MTAHELAHFMRLSYDEQANAVRRLAALGWSEATIACATQLAVDVVRDVLLESAEALLLAEFGRTRPRSVAV